MNTTRRRVAQLITALAIVAGLGVATAGTAAAANVGEWACNYNSSRNTCLYIANLGDHRYAVHVGIDIHMSQQDAQNIVDSGFVPWADLWGDDGSAGVGSHGYLTSIPITGLWANSGGLSAEFDIQVAQNLLNEDTDTNDADEIVAFVHRYDPSANRTYDYRSGRVISAFVSAPGLG